MALTARVFPPQERHRRHGVLAVLHPVAVALAGGLAGLGALTRPGPTALLGAVVAAGTWALVHRLHGAGATDLPGLPHPAVPVTGALVGTAAVVGTAGLGLVAVGILGALTAVVVAVARWCRPVPADSWPRTHLETDPDTEEDTLVELLRALPLDALLDEWRRTGAPGDPSPAGPTSRSRMRRLLIGELARRDPVGTGRWLREAPDTTPDGYLADRRDRAA